jgi:3-hydroxybutyryl-CoA dehydrogenase
MDGIRNVLVVGAGTMGHSIAQVFAQGGLNVQLADSSAEALSRANTLIAANLQTFVDLHLLEEEDKRAALDRIRMTQSLEEAGEKADLAVEAVFENIQTKKEIFKALDEVCPAHAILASNTSYLDIFKFIETKRADRIAITHWFAPPHIIPLVEIVSGPQTSRETVDALKALLIRLGKRPIVLSKFLPGFIANRLQSALRFEVLHLLENGYATAEEIDEATKASFGLRIPLLGLVQSMDFGGIDSLQRIIANHAYEPPVVRDRSETIDRLVAQGRLGIKSGKGFYDYGGRSAAEMMRERDIKLIKLIRTLQGFE